MRNDQESGTLLPMNRDVDFLYELGAIRLIDRQWRRFHSQNFANLADHHFRVAWIALVIAAREGGKIDTGKLVKMALVHDLAESRTGDVDYLSRQYVTRDEAAAVRDMFDETSVGKEFIALLEEYEKRECLEAKIVKDADNLDVDMELCEQAMQGNALRKTWQFNRRLVADTKLYTKTARHMWDEIQSTDPDHWHAGSPKNRVNGGDWKPEKA
jgi:putative hydrolase of HD superfamily